MCRETRSEELVDDGGDHGDHDEVGKQLHAVDDETGQRKTLLNIAAATPTMPRMRPTMDTSSARMASTMPLVHSVWSSLKLK